MTVTAEQEFKSIISDKNRKRFIESFLVIEDKSRRRVPYILNPIQSDVHETETGRDIYVKPAQVGFSSERLATRLVDTLVVPGTNTVLIAYEDFITERLLSKTAFYYNHLRSHGIPGFPEIKHDSAHEKTFEFKVGGIVMSKSSIYIASARSFVAGRAETIHHLLADEYAFWAPGSVERIFIPAMQRVPPDGTADIFSTPNGLENDFYDAYAAAKDGTSVFTPHFYTWYMHPEYNIKLGDLRIERFIKETNVEEFELTEDEDNLYRFHNLTYDQIRWRRWKIMEMESLRRKGESRTLFPQEYPEDDVTCFLATGDMYYDQDTLSDIARKCSPAPINKLGLSIWYEPEEGKHYMVSCDPGQAKITKTAISVITWDADNVPTVCARDVGLYGPEITMDKMIEYGNYYNHAELTWEANSHGLALAPLADKYKNVYWRQDVVSKRVTSVPGWLTTPRLKDYMLQTIMRNLHHMKVHDIEFVNQCRNIRLAGDKVVIVGSDDLHDAIAIGLVCHSPKSSVRGCVGHTGWKW